MGLKWYHILIFVACVVAVVLLARPSDRDRGLQLELAGDLHRAEAYLRKAFEKDPTDEKVLAKLLEVYRETDQLRRAIPLLEEWMARHPADQQSRDLLVDLKIETGDIQGAVGILNSFEQTPETKALLVGLYEQVGQLAEAVEVLETTLTGGPDDVEILQHIARLERWRLNPQGEMRTRKRIVNLHKDRQTLADLLEISIRLEDLETALAVAGEIEDFKDLDIDLLRKIRTVYLRIRRRKEAVRVALRICERPDYTPEDALTCSLLQSWSGSAREGVATLEVALERYRNHLNLLRSVASQSHQLGMLEKSAEWFKRIAEVTGLEADWHNAARVKADAGLVTEGLNLLADHADPETASAQTLWLWCMLALEAGERRQAEELALLLAKKAKEQQNQPERAALAAELFSRIGNPQQEARMLQIVSQARPDAPEVLLDLVRAYTDSGQFNQALNILNRLDTTPGTDARAVRRERARYRVEAMWVTPASDPKLTAIQKETVTALEASLADEEDPDLMVELARLYLLLKRREDAIRLLAKIKEAPGPLWVAVAEAFADAQDADSVRYALSHLGERPEMKAMDFARVASVYETLGDRKLALLWTDRARQVYLSETRDPALEVELARLYLSLERTEIAVQLLEGVKDAPASIWLAMAEAFAEVHDGQSARRAVARIGEGTELSAGELARLGDVYLALGDSENAVLWLEKALAKAPHDDIIRVTLADAYGTAGNRNRQYEIMEARARAGSKKEWLEAADRHLWNNDLEGEEQLLAEALKLYPEASELMRRRMLTLAVLGHYQEARRLYRNLWALGGTYDPNTMKAAAATLAALGDIADAKLLYQRILEDNPEDTDALVGLAGLAVEQMQYPEAIGLYRRYLSLVPNDGYRWYELGEAIYEDGGDGRREQDRAMGLIPLGKDPVNITMYARISWRRGRLGEAIRLYEQALSAGIWDADLVADYIVLLLEVRMLDQAERALRLAFAVYPGHLRLLRLEAHLLLERRRYRDAVRILQGLHARRPQNLGIQSELAYAEEMVGNTASAMVHYDEVIRDGGQRRR